MSSGSFVTFESEHTAKAVSLAGERSGNYILPDEEERTCTYVIEPRTVTLTWSGDEDLEYDGTAKNVTATVGNLLELLLAMCGLLHL